MATSSPVQDEAVSPIVGVLLMVAVTILVAGVLFVLVQGISGGDKPAPLVQFLRDSRDGRIQVVDLNKDDIDLVDVDLKISADGYFAFNERASASGVEAPDGVFVGATDTPGTLLQAGDYFEFCLDGPSDSITVFVRITTPPDVTIYENSITGIRSCS